VIGRLENDRFIDDTWGEFRLPEPTGVWTPLVHAVPEEWGIRFYDPVWETIDFCLLPTIPLDPLAILAANTPLSTWEAAATYHIHPLAITHTRLALRIRTGLLERLHRGELPPGRWGLRRNDKERSDNPF